MKRLILPTFAVVAGLVAGVLLQRFFPLGRLFGPGDTAPVASLFDIRVAAFSSTPPAPPGGTVFLGDSHIECGRWPERWSSPSICRGISGATVAQVRTLVPEVARHRPSLVVVQCGTNDILAGTDPSAEYTAIVRSLLDTTSARVIVCEVPTLAAHVAESEQRNRQTSALNAHFRTLAENRVLICPLPLADADRAADGIHLSPRGYAAWERELVTVTAPRR